MSKWQTYRGCLIEPSGLLWDSDVDWINTSFLEGGGGDSLDLFFFPLVLKCSKSKKKKKKAHIANRTEYVWVDTLKPSVLHPRSRWTFLHVARRPHYAMVWPRPFHCPAASSICMCSLSLHVSEDRPSSGECIIRTGLTWSSVHSWIGHTQTQSFH